MFDKLNKKLLELIISLTPAEDKLGHFFWGSIYASIGLMGVGILSIFTNGWLLGIIPFAFATGMGLLKEIRDGQGHGNKELADLVFTSIPSIPISLLLFIILT